MITGVRSKVIAHYDGVRLPDMKKVLSVEFIITMSVINRFIVIYFLDARQFTLHEYS